MLSRILIGEKWHEITYASDFIGQPGTLVPGVKRYLLVATDEESRTNRVGKLADFVFSLEEQKLPDVSGGTPATKVIVKAGHVEIVGESGVTPFKLIRVLQDQGFIRQTSTARLRQFDELLARLYGSNAHSPQMLSTVE